MHYWLFFIIVIAHVHLGYFISKRNQNPFFIILAWINVFASVYFIHVLFLDKLPVTRMLVLIITALVALKNVVVVSYYPAGSPLRYWQWICFSIGWFGMRPSLFERLRFSDPDFNRHKHLLIKGLSRAFAGCFLITLTPYFIPEDFYYLKTLLLLIGLSLLLHFGILNIQAWWWNSWGADCKELFKSPLKSKSLSEFWGKRWNMAFSEMTALAVYRPVKKRFGVGVGIVAAFIFSGLLHEMAISLPVMAGFGLPLLYFVIHGILMQLEERVGWVKRMLSNEVIAHCWVLFWLLVPMPLLFHKAFINGQ